MSKSRTTDNATTTPDGPDTLRAMAGASTIGDAGDGDAGYQPDPTPVEMARVMGAGGTSPASTTEGAPGGWSGSSPRPIRKMRPAKPKPVRFSRGEEITLNSLVICREDFQEIRGDVAVAFLEWMKVASESDGESTCADVDSRRRRAMRFLDHLSPQSDAGGSS